MQKNHKYTLKKEKIECAEKIKPEHFDAAVLPKMVDLRSKMPPIYDQQELGSCTANAVAASMQFEELNYQGSRLFLYYNERKLDGDIDQDGGSTITTAIKALKKFGLCQEKDWPYDETKFKICPPKTCYDAALQNKVINAHIVSADALKQTLASGFPIAFGTILFSSFESDEVAKTGIIPMPTDDENSVGGHAMSLVGYDDDKKVFIVRNSWGTSWGLVGYCYFPYEYFTDDENLASDYWVITNISHPAFKLAKKMYD